MTRASAQGDLPRERGDGGEAIDGQPGHGAAVLLAAEETAGRCALVRSTVRPGGEPPPHIHRREDGVCYVLAGELTYHVGGAAHRAPAGACIYLPRDVEHRFVVRSPVARVLTFYAPGAVAGALRELRAPIPAALALERLVAVAATYGCDIVGPGPDPTDNPSSTSQLAPRTRRPIARTFILLSAGNARPT